MRSLLETRDHEKKLTYFFFFLHSFVWSTGRFSAPNEWYVTFSSRAIFFFFLVAIKKNAVCLFSVSVLVLYAGLFTRHSAWLGGSSSSTHTHSHTHTHTHTVTHTTHTHTVTHTTHTHTHTQSHTLTLTQSYTHAHTHTHTRTHTHAHSHSHTHTHAHTHLPPLCFFHIPIPCGVLTHFSRGSNASAFAEVIGRWCCGRGRGPSPRSPATGQVFPEDGGTGQVFPQDGRTGQSFGTRRSLHPTAACARQLASHALRILRLHWRARCHHWLAPHVGRYEPGVEFGRTASLHSKPVVEIGCGVTVS